MNKQTNKIIMKDIKQINTIQELLHVGEEEREGKKSINYRTIQQDVVLEIALI
mgnify:FL=1